MVAAAFKEIGQGLYRRPCLFQVVFNIGLELHVDDTGRPQ